MKAKSQTYIMQKSASHCYSTADRFCKISPIIFIGDGCGSGFVNRTGFNLSQETSQRRQYWCTVSGSKGFWSKPSKEYFSNCLVDQQADKAELFIVQGWPCHARNALLMSKGPPKPLRESTITFHFYDQIKHDFY